MYGIERQDKILNILKEKKSCSVSYLSKELLFSEATIRRDLNELSKQMKIRKTFGGAVILESYSSVISKGLPIRLLPSVMLWGAPGVGKSQGVREIAKEIEFQTDKKVIVTDVRLLLFNPIERDLICRRLHRLRRGRYFIKEKYVNNVRAVVHLKNLRLEPNSQGLVRVGGRNSSKIYRIE